MWIKKTKTNDQVILEAKANIDLAKMMNALNNIKSSTQWLDTYKLETMEKWAKEILRFITSMQELKKLKDCVFNEASIAKDIVDGITSRARYIERANEQKRKMEISDKLNSELTNENHRLKRLLVSMIEKFEIDWQELDINWIRVELASTAIPLKTIQEKAYSAYISQLPEKCRMDEKAF